MNTSLSLSPTLWGALALLLGSCGESTEQALESYSGSTVQFLELSLSAEGAEEPAAQVFQALEATDSSAWIVEGGEHRVAHQKIEPGTKAVSTFVIENQESLTLLRIPGPFDSASFNCVALRARWNGKWEAAVELRSNGDLLARTAGLIVPPQMDQGTLIFDFPETRHFAEPVDEIVLHLTESSKGLGVYGVDLIHRPIHLFLPEVEGGPRLVNVEGDQRNAVGLSDGRKVKTQVENSTSSILRFSYGVPGKLRRSREKAELHVHIFSQGEHVGHVTHSLGGIGKALPWEQVILPLAEYGVGQLEIEWELESKSPGLESVCALGDVTLVSPGGEHRVVVLVTSDTHRGDHLGAASSAVEIDTPRLDELGARGVFFEDCFSSTNITNPSHIAIMTGMHPRDIGIFNNYTRVADQAPTLAEAFRGAGYVTYAAISAKHLSDSSSGLGQGFERVSFPSGAFSRDASVTLSQLQEWIEESAGLPVFVWLHLFDAHMPYGADTPGVARYYPGKRKAFDTDLPKLPLLARRTAMDLKLDGLRDLDYPRAMYKAEITDLDSRLGDLLDMPFFDQAVIGITGDHGESLGEHDLYFAHEELYSGTLHVPLILNWPGAPAGARFSGPVSNLDLGRTLLDLSGNLGVEFPGDNLALLLEEGASRSAVFSLSAHVREAAITDGDWHLQLRLKNNDMRMGIISRPKHRVELYYLPDDPNSRTDLAAKEPQRAKEMRARLVEWLASAQNLNWLGESTGNAAFMEGLSALGYATGEEGSTPDAAPDLAPAPDCDCEWCESYR
jgi:arylsulfatase